jgi:hypothetical protein
VIAIAVLLAITQLEIASTPFFWIIAVIATVRSAIDYWINLYDYFPLSPDAAA